MCALVVLVPGVYESRFFYFMPVKGRSLIKFKLLGKPVKREGEKAVHAFLDDACRICSDDGHLIFCKGVLFDHEMINGNGICKNRCACDI